MPVNQYKPVIGELVIHVRPLNRFIWVMEFFPVMQLLNSDRKYPERFTDDIFRDELPELEFRLEEAASQQHLVENTRKASNPAEFVQDIIMSCRVMLGLLQRSPVGHGLVIFYYGPWCIICYSC